MCGHDTVVLISGYLAEIFTQTSEEVGKKYNTYCVISKCYYARQFSTRILKTYSIQILVTFLDVSVVRNIIMALHNTEAVYQELFHPRNQENLVD